MAVIVLTSPVTGSLRIDTYGGTPNSSASPMSRFLANLQTVDIGGYANSGGVNSPGQYLTIANSQQQQIFEAQLQNISQIGTSASTSFPTLNQAIVATANLIMH